MKIGFDLSQVAFGGGVGRYTQYLASELAALLKEDISFFYASLRQPYTGNLSSIKKYPLPPTFTEPFFNRIRIAPIELFIGSIDIYHSSDWTQPPTKAKKVTTYHDVVPIKYPQWSHPKNVEVHTRRLKIVEKEIDKVIAVSEATKQDLLECTKIPAEKIVLIYEGVSPQFAPQKPAAIANFKQKYNLPEEFILAIGGIGTRRNLERVKEATKDYNLVISGQTIPRVSDQELPLLYASAKMLVYPSFYEGFGLPIVEAFATGIPVITSNVSSMPEIAGDAAILIDPLNTSQLKEKIDELWHDKKLQQVLQKKGFQRAKDFTWKKCAQETVKVYQELL